jgi:hypothetical protein
MAIRPAFAAVRTTFALVEYLVQPWRFVWRATQSPFFRCPTTLCWSRSVTDPGPEIQKTIRPCESLGLDTVSIPRFGFDTAGAGFGVAAGGVAGWGVVAGAGGIHPGPVWFRKNAYMAAVASGPFGSE